MSAVVADTLAVIWFLSGSSKLSPAALLAFNSAASSGNPVWVPSITLVELTYLTERGRLPIIALERLRAALADLLSLLQIASLDEAVANAVARVPRDTVPDMPDRIIAATAVARNLPLITCDSRIRKLQMQIIW